MNLTQSVDLWDYLDIFWRRKFFFIIPFVLVLAATIIYLKHTPNIYRASTLILVESQKVPTSYVKPTVTESVQAQLRTITEQIMSRTYLERIIKEFNLYPQLRQKLPLESVIEKMRRCIRVEVRKGRVFSVSFEDTNPQIAMKVANRLASLFIEENLKVREARAEGTIDFLERELERVRKILKQQEKEISEFRAKNLGVLPEQLEANLRTLDRLQLQLRNTTEALRTAEQTRVQLQQQLSQMQQMSNLNQNDLITVDENNTPSLGENSQLEKLKSHLAQLKLKYTDKHPEVIRLKKIIAQLEKEIASKEANVAPQENSISAPSVSPWIAQIEAQLMQLDAEIAKLKEEEKQLKAKIRKYQHRVEITPKIEQQLKELMRGYKVTQKEYQSLLDKKLQAELAANLERKQKGEQFKVLDPAKLPEKPYKPNRPRLLMLGVMLGLAVGGGLVFLVEYMDNAFYKIEDLEKFTQLPVLACLPEIKIKKKKIRLTEIPDLQEIME